jgi:uncharacterized protein (TIGR02231 family)
MTSTTPNTSTSTNTGIQHAGGLVTHHPAVDETRVAVLAPVRRATLLEDRAQITRLGRFDVVAGRNRLIIWDVAPTLQDVSLRVTATSNAGGVRVDDARARRAARVLHTEKPEAARHLEEKLAELARRHDELRDDAERVQHRASIVAEMMEKALAEVPEDAAWSIGDATAWKQTFETLSAKSRALLAGAQDTRQEMRTLAEAVAFVVEERRRIDRPDTRVLGLIEVDLQADVAGSVDIVIEYTVPNAIWRPTHEATLRDQTLTIASRAAVWQNTGEDWNDVELSFSTARSSLGHEPPLLNDDTLAVQKKDNRVVVQAREVSVSRAGLGRGAGGGGGGGAPPSTAVDLPGVDDGGDIQNLKAAHPVTVPSTGRPSFVPLSTFQAPAQTSLLVMAEADEKAVLKATCAHLGTHPLLAGPVDLLRSSGPVGSTRTLFIAPGEQLALGFGPDDDVRVKRSVDSKEVVDEIDQWRRRTVTVNLYLSNLGPDEKALEIVERLPVSEIEHVKVTLQSDKTSGAPSLDDDGFLRWTMSLGGRGRLRLSLVYTVAFAPGVTSG